MCTPMFIAALFIIVRTWKQPRCPSADEWIRKLWYIYTMEYSVQFSSVAQSCLTLCDPMDYTVRGILQAGILEWIAFPVSRGSSQPRDRTQVSCIAGGFFTI